MDRPLGELVKARARVAGLVGAALAVGLAAAVLVPFDDAEVDARPRAPRSATLDLSAYPATAPSPSLRLLFIHHSCGGQLLAPEGPDVGAGCIYRSHPNGGDLRARLAREGYEVREASYGSALGEDTDLFDWLPKFRDRMDSVLACDGQDRLLANDRMKNDIVVFKSCFPNNAFSAEGSPPGDPRGPDLTLWNARATLSALLPQLARHPEVLFVYVTAPPIAPRRTATLAQRVRDWVRGETRGPDPATSAAIARSFDDWVRAPDGWLRDYALRNVVVFDYYDVLTGDGRSNLSVFATDGETDSHPSAEGNARAAARFVPFLHRAVHRARD